MPHSMRAIALDLEGTLISNAISCFTRPGLFHFLEFCQTHFERVVIYSMVSPHRVKSVISFLVGEGSVPSWMNSVPILTPEGTYKDLRAITGIDVDEILIVDDQESYIEPSQRSQWVPIESYCSPYSPTDDELVRVQKVLRMKLGLQSEAGTEHQ